MKPLSHTTASYRKSATNGCGASPTNPRIGLTGAVIVDIFYLGGIPIEISEYSANSLQGKALAGEV